ncbi:RepB family plasmid replication initiator protein [Alteromonas sp. A079]|uniref:RepB family plasmid replication initiator protein n=1 Tax=Alteromonas sp. A079 TaxID=3410268 RepID=UPI003B9F25E3
MKNNPTVYKNSTLHLSSLLHSPIFASKSTNLKNDLIEVSALSTQNERIVYKGLLLDADRDFRLFSAIMTKFYQNNKFNEVDNFDRKVVFSKEELYEITGIESNNRNRTVFQSLLGRLENIEQARLTLFKYEEGQNVFDDLKAKKRINFPLLAKTEYDLESGILSIMLHPEIGSLDYQAFSKQFINMNEYDKLGSQYSKAIYLYLKTRIFKNSKNVILSVDLATIWDRMTHSKSMSNSEKNRCLKSALMANKEIKLFKDFKILTRERKVKIILNPPKQEEFILPM